MKKPYFKTWQGANYAKYRTVIMSESTYDWPVNGRWHTPTRDHLTLCVQRLVEGRERAKYYQRMNRAICRSESPTHEQMRRCWNDFGYTVFLQESLRGVSVRPTTTQWRRANAMFPKQLEQFDPKPRKLIVTGTIMWNWLPLTGEIQLTKGVQAIEHHGELLWCLALPHTSNRDEGFNWDEIGVRIQAFLHTSFPKTLK